MKILVLGGDGYLGRSLQVYLPQAIIFDLSKGNNLLETPLDYFSDFDIIIDLLNLSNNKLIEEFSEYNKKVITKKTELRNYIKDKNIKYIFASTANLYGSNLNYNIESRVYASDLYTSYMLEQEKEISNILNNYTILRISTLMGVSKDKVKSDLLINKVANNEIKYLFGGNQSRNFLHVDDAARDISKVMHSSKNIINIFSPYNYKIKDLFPETPIKEFNDKINLATNEDPIGNNYKAVKDTITELKNFLNNNQSYNVYNHYTKYINKDN